MGGKTKTATSTTSPPAAVQAQYQALLDRASGVSQLPYQNTVAPFNPSQQAAFGQFDQIPGQYLGQATADATAAGAPINAGQIQNYTNPFQSDVIDATMANINETNAEQQNQVKGNAIAQGALGGNRTGVAQGELARQQGLANNATLAGLNAANYQQALAAAQADRAAAGAGAGLFGNLQSQAIQGATAQLGAGTVQQEQASQELQNQASFPYQQSSWLSQILGTTGPLEGTTTTQKTPAPGILGQIVGGGLALLGLPGGSLGGKLLSGLFGGSGGGATGAANASLGSSGLLPALYKYGGGIGMRPAYAYGGGIGGSYGGGVGSGGMPDMLTKAIAMARAMKAGMGGIGTPHMASGGITATALSPFSYDPYSAVPIGAGLPTSTFSPTTTTFGPDASTFSPAPNPQPSIIPSPLPAPPAATPITPIGWSVPPDPYGITDPSTAAADATATDTTSPDQNVPTVSDYANPTATSAPTAPAAAAAAAGIAPSTASPAGGIGSAQHPILNAFLNRPLNVPLIAAGLGMLASQSPFFGTQIGEGGLAGVKTYQDQQAAAATLAQQKAQQDYQNRTLDLEAARLDQTSRNEAASLALQAKPKYARIGTDTFNQPIYGFITADGQVTDISGNPVGSTDGFGNVDLASGPTATPDDANYATAVIPNTGGLTQAAIDQKALSNLANGVQPPTGRTGAAGMQNAAISNRMAAIGGNLAGNKADFKALSSSLGTQTSYLNNVQRSFNTANTTLQSILGWMQQNNINPSQFPDFNSMINYGATRGLDVGPVRGFMSQIAQLRAEYAQVLARNGDLTDSVRGAANAVIPDNISPKDLATVASRLNVDAQNAVDAVTQQIGTIRNQISGLAQLPGVPSGGSSGAPTGGSAPTTTAIAHPTTQAAYDALPIGAQYVNPSDGQIYVKFQ